jgi:hypothetical protein
MKAFTQLLSMGEFDSGDIAEAIYYWCEANHSGQNSDGYEALCRILHVYTPSRCGSVDTMSDSARLLMESIESESDALALAKMVEGGEL